MHGEVLTLSFFSGCTGSRCSHEILDTLSSSGRNTLHMPPCKQYQMEGLNMNNHMERRMCQK